jgi:cellulose biosynthesis protein BcsQ
LFQELATDLGRPLDLVYLATRFDRSQALARELLVAMQARFAREMLTTVIRRDMALREAAAYGVPVRKLDPASRGALDHDALARELSERTRAETAHHVSSVVTPLSARNRAFPTPSPAPRPRVPSVHPIV